MITKKADNIEITIDKEPLEQSIACMEDMLEFYQAADEKQECLCEHINIAIETMKAFWVEHFAEEGSYDIWGTEAGD